MFSYVFITVGSSIVLSLNHRMGLALVQRLIGFCSSCKLALSGSNDNNLHQYRRLDLRSLAELLLPIGPIDFKYKQIKRQQIGLGRLKKNHKNLSELCWRMAALKSTPGPKLISFWLDCLKKVNFLKQEGSWKKCSWITEALRLKSLKTFKN